MITITITVQEFKPDQIIEGIVGLAIQGNKGNRKEVLTSLLRECQTQLFKMHKEEVKIDNERKLEKEF